MVTAHRNREVLLTSTGAVSVLDEGKGGRNGSQGMRIFCANLTSAIASERYLRVIAVWLLKRRGIYPHSLVNIQKFVLYWDSKPGGLRPAKDKSSHNWAIASPPCRRTVSQKLNIWATSLAPQSLLAPPLGNWHWHCVQTLSDSSTRLLVNRTVLLRWAVTSDVTKLPHQAHKNRKPATG